MAKAYRKPEIAKNIIDKMSDIDKLFLVIMLSNGLTLEMLLARLESLSDRKKLCKFKAEWFAATLNKSYYEQLVKLRGLCLEAR